MQHAEPGHGLCGHGPEGDDDALRETTEARETLLLGGFLHVVRDTVRLPDGTRASREYIRHPGAVVVVPLLDDRKVVLERQWRHPIGQAMIELPAGKLDGGEAPLACAARELREETGYRAAEWALAGRMHLAIAYSDEVLHIAFARGLVAGERQLDRGEFLDVFAATPDELWTAVRAGQITDAKTLAALLWLDKVMSGTWTLDWQPAPTAGSGDNPAHEGT